MPDPSESSSSIDDFVQRVDLEKRCAAREVVELMRSQLGEVDERVEGGTAVFSKNGKDITGIKIEEDHFSLFVPDARVSDDYSRTLGKVSRESDGIRFDQLVDINRGELRRMIDSLGRENESESGAPGGPDLG